MKGNHGSALFIAMMCLAGALAIVNTPNGPYGVFTAPTPSGPAYASVPLTTVSTVTTFPANNPNNYYLLPGYNPKCATLYPGDKGYCPSYPPYNRPGSGSSSNGDSSSRRGKKGGLNIYGIPTSISIPVVIPNLPQIPINKSGSSSRRRKQSSGGSQVIVLPSPTPVPSKKDSSSRRGGKKNVVIIPDSSSDENCSDDRRPSRRPSKGDDSSSRRGGSGGVWYPNGAYPGSPNQGYWNNNGNFNQNSFGANGGNGASAVVYQQGVQCLMVPTFGNPAALINSFLTNLNSNLSNGASTWNLIYQNAVNNVYYYIYSLATGTSGAQYIGIGFNAGNSQVVGFAMSPSVSQIAGMLGVPIPTTTQAINCGNLQCVYTRNCSPNTAAPTLIGSSAH